VKRLLILLPDIWSMKKYQGMPSIHNFLIVATERFDCVIFTTDENNVEVDYPNAKVYKFKKFTTKSSNRYVQYLCGRLNFISINCKYYYKSISLRLSPDIIYCSSSLPVLSTRILKIFYTSKSVHRIYGTFLHENISSVFDKIKKYEEYLSFFLDADKYIITNDGTKGDLVAEKFSIPKSNIEFLMNGVDFKPHVSSNIMEELRNTFKIPKEHLVAISVSRLSSWKRVDRIIKAFNFLENVPISLIVVGDGPQREEWEELKTNKNINFSGSLLGYEVNSIMRSADIFISMYDYSNVGNPLLEALTFGLPIITVSSGGTIDIITHDQNGLIIDYSQDENHMVINLKSNIEYLVFDSEKREELSRKAVEFAKENILDWNSRIKLEVDIIDLL